MERVGGPVTGNLQKQKRLWSDRLNDSSENSSKWRMTPGNGYSIWLHEYTYGERSSDCTLPTSSDCWFIACGFVASREPSQRISEAEMFNHLPSISDAQYFLSHETVCWMVMAKRWKASNVPTSSTCYRMLLNILNLHGVPKCERSKAHSKSYRRMFPVSSARSKWKNLSWNRVFQHEKILSSQFSWSKNPWVEHGGTGVPTESYGLIISHPTTLATLCCQRIHDLRAMHDLFSHCLSPFITKLNDFP